jgi:hypothetical protein
MQSSTQTQRSEKDQMTPGTDNVTNTTPYYFGAISGNAGRFVVTMYWDNPPAPGDTAEMDQWLRQLTEPESDPPAPRPSAWAGPRELETFETHVQYLARVSEDPARTVGGGKQRRQANQSGGALDRPDQINIDARTGPFSDFQQPRQQPASAASFARCGNCGDRIPLTGDAMRDHHAAMRHKQTCRTNTVYEEGLYNREEYDRIVTENAAQPMQTKYRERAALALQAAATEALRLLPAGERLEAPPARPWWKFWK